MYKPIYLFIALRYLWNVHLPNFKKIFIFLSIISIMISTISAIITISVINGSENNFKNNTLSFIPHLIITNNNQYIKNSDFPKNIFKIHNVKKVSDLISKEIIVQSKYHIAMAEIIGVDKKNNYNLGNYNKKEIVEMLKKEHDYIIIGAQLAKKLHVYCGDKINLMLLSNNKNQFLGKLFNQHVFKIIGIFSTHHAIDDYQIFMNKKNSLKFLKYSKNYVSGWRVWLHDPLILDICEFKKITNKLLLLDWRLKQGELFKAMKIEKYIMFFLFFLILIVSALNIFINLTTYIVENKNVIAILQTQGLSNWKIMLIFIIFGSGNAIIGNILGTILAILLIIKNNFLNFVINYLFNENNIPIILVPSQIVLINMISILIAIFSTLYPAWNAIKSTPVRVLSDE